MPQGIARLKCVQVGVINSWLGALAASGILFAVLLVSTSPMFGQSAAAGNIHGTVTDQSNAIIPGAKITLTSPAMLVPQTTTSDASGSYHFEQLPVGVYTMKFQQAGFQQLIRQNIQITAGFSAEINVQLAVGQVSQTVTVDVAGPVIDTTSTSVSSDITAVQMADQLPVTHTMQEMVDVTPGTTPSTAPDLGGGGIPTFTLQAYGITGQATTLIDGINTRKSSNNAESDFDYTALEEFQVIPTAGTADIALPGVYLNAVVKTGSDRFHARGEVSGENRDLEGNNLTPLLRSQGFSQPSLILNTVQAGLNGGGPIKKGRWWIFGGGFVNSNNRNALGYVLPDGSPGVEYGRLTNATVKSTYQMTKNWKLVGFWTQNTAYFPNRFGSATTPYYSTSLYTEPVRDFKGEVQGTPTSRLVLDFYMGHHMYQANYYAHNEPQAVAIPTILDTATSQNYGPTIGQDRRGRRQTQITSSVSFIPAGNHLGQHELKFGETWMLMWTGTETPSGLHVNPYGVPGNYVLLFNNGNPTSIRFYDYPIASNREDLHEGGIYAEDTWRLGKFLTVNIGVRYDRFANSIPSEVQQPTAFGPPWAPPAAGTDPNIWTGAGGHFSSVNTGTFNAFAPRIGGTWDVFGNGKTVYKASYGRYNWTSGDDFGAPFNAVAETIATYAWAPGGGCTEAAAVAGTCDYVPGSVDLDPNGPAFQNLQGGSNGSTAKLANSVINPHLSEQYSNIYQTILEHQLAPNLSVRAGFTYVDNVNTWLQIPTQIPYSAWNIPYTMYDQGPNTPACFVPVLPRTTACSADTIANAPHYTIYDLQPGYASLTQTEYVNRPSNRSDHISTFEAAVTKRSSSGRWNLLASYSYSMNHVWIVPPSGNLGETAALPIQVNPNQTLFPLNTDPIWTMHASGNYRLPWKFNVSGMFAAYNGYQGQRTESVPLPNAGNTTIAVTSFGGYTSPVRELTSLKFERDFGSDRLGRFKPAIEVLNLFNSAAVWGVSTFNSSANFGRISSADTPRIARFGVVYEF